MNFYISDLHLYHLNIITKLDKRPFKNEDEMHEYIVEKWNEKISANDDVYIVGDLSFGSGYLTNELLKRLKGRKHLVIGNHDAKLLRGNQIDRSLIQSIRDYYEIDDGGRRVVISHYPMMFYNGQYRTDANGVAKTYMLYGHIHDTQDMRLMEQLLAVARNFTFKNKHTGEICHIPFNLINCFCMYSDFTPLTLDEWIVNDKANGRNKY